MRSGQENVLFRYIIAIAYTDIVGQFGCDKNAFPFSQCSCGFIQNTLATAYDSIKKTKGFSVLHNVIIFTHYAQYCIVIGTYVGETVGYFQFATSDLDTSYVFDNVRTFGKQWGFNDFIV